MMNAESSRSHAIFTLIVESSQVVLIMLLIPDQQVADGTTCVRMGKLNLVDLAGSERVSKTGATVCHVINTS